MASEGVTISPDRLRGVIRTLFTRAGVSEANAATAADAFVWAESRGVGSHGVARVPRYLELFASGEANAQPDIKVSHPRPGVVTVDADRAPGAVALTLAMDAAIAAARTNGVAWASVRKTVHTGAIGFYVERAAKADMVAIGLVAGMPNMGYVGAKGAAVATSPIAIAVPSAKHGVVLLDMATATIALGRIAEYKRKGQALPEGAALDKEGRPTTDPNVAAIPTPMSGAKGSGLSLMIEMLTGLLAGASILIPFHGGAPGGRKHRQNAALIVADISAFTDVATFKAEVDATLEALKGLPKDEGVEAILFPGERGARTAAARGAGIPLGPKLWGEIRDLLGEDVALT
jgi:ureidoglycolate dehydrogenase (NAD+)